MINDLALLLLHPQVSHLEPYHVPRCLCRHSCDGPFGSQQGVMLTERAEDATQQSRIQADDLGTLYGGREHSR